jgi:hypothetical protein
MQAKISYRSNFIPILIAIFGEIFGFGIFDGM